MTNKSKKRKLKNIILRDEPISQPMSTTRDHPQRPRVCFDMSNCGDATMASTNQEHRTLQQGCLDKEKAPVVVSRTSSKRIYHGCPSKQDTHFELHHQFVDMPQVGHTNMSCQPYNISAEEARIEEELINGSYELNSRIMARLWEESRSEDEHINEMGVQPDNSDTEESTFRDEMHESFEERRQGIEKVDNPIIKHRGPTYMQSVWGRPLDLQRHQVDYNEYGQPIGGESSMLCHFLGTVARNGKYCPIDVKNWHQISRKKKKEMLEIVKLRFYVRIDAEKWVLSSIGDKWRNWKHHLKTIYWKEDVPVVQLVQLVEEKDKRVKLDQWVKLLTYWSSDEAKEASNRNKKARAKKTMKQLTGKRSFAKVREKLRGKLGRSPNRCELFGVCFVKSDESSNQLNDDASRKFLEMKERNKQLAEGSEDPIGPNDVFTQTMGPDRPGHVRMMGKGICQSDLWGELPRSTSNRILKEQQSRIEKLEIMLQTQQGRGAEVPSVHHGLSTNCISNRATTNLPLTVGAYVTLKSLFNPNKIVAKGCINSINPCSEVGGQLLGSNWCEVNVKAVFEPEEELIRPYDNLQKFEHVLGEMIAWPCNLVTPSEV